MEWWSLIIVDHLSLFHLTQKISLIARGPSHTMLAQRSGGKWKKPEYKKPDIGEKAAKIDSN